MIFSLALFDLDMAICCNLGNLYFIVLHFTQVFKSIILHSVWVTSLSALGCYEFCNFIWWLVKKLICKIFGVLPRTITCHHHLKNNYPPFLMCLISCPVHLTICNTKKPHLQYQKNIYLECNKKMILKQMEYIVRIRVSTPLKNTTFLAKPPLKSANCPSSYDREKYFCL